MSTHEHRIKMCGVSQVFIHSSRPSLDLLIHVLLRDNYSCARTITEIFSLFDSLCWCLKFSKFPLDFSDGVLISKIVHFDLFVFPLRFPNFSVLFPVQASNFRCLEIPNLVDPINKFGSWLKRRTFSCAELNLSPQENDDFSGGGGGGGGEGTPINFG